MTKVDIYSGFLGAGKTTLIKKLIKDAYAGQKIVLIENEFGQIGIDGGFLKEAGIEITEMNSGCICCSLVGDFGEALKKVQNEFSPDRIVIEPSGVGKLSDVIKAVEDSGATDLQLSAVAAVIDASKCKMYMKNFSEFYSNQIEHASAIVLSRTDGIRADKLNECIEIIRKANENAPIVTTPWDQIDGKAILEAAESKSSAEERLKELMHENHGHECDCHDHDHHEHQCGCHDHDHHDHECGCHDHDHHDHECGCHDHDHHEHHHHHHHVHECDDPDCHCHEHHHEHECNDPECECHHHEHGHGHHHADDVFTSWGVETADKYTLSDIEECLDELMTGKFGMVLRAKGIVASADGQWIHFDYVPGEKSVRYGAPDITGKLCVIGTDLDKHGLHHLFERG